MEENVFCAGAGNEFELIDMCFMNVELLPYSLKSIHGSHGVQVQVYDIPMEEKAGVLEKLYPFSSVPGMDEERYDLHQNEYFTVRDFLVVRKDNKNYLVSPYFPKSGGTVLDWLEGETQGCVVNTFCKPLSSGKKKR